MVLFVFQQLERAHVHDNLEVETINASILRHQLQALPVKIRTEITGTSIFKFMA